MIAVNDAHFRPAKQSNQIEVNPAELSHLWVNVDGEQLLLVDVESRFKTSLNVRNFQCVAHGIDITG